MCFSKRYVWIEAEIWPAGSWNCKDENSDVIVVFPDRSKWTATVFTYQNIETLRRKNIQTGECMNGAYFQSVFNRYPDVEAEDDENYPVGFFITEESSS